jgi:hypothetical protein
MFDSIPISMLLISEIEAVSLTRSLQRVGAINEKRMSEHPRCGRFKLCM